jgi:hypothetical protein
MTKRNPFLNDEIRGFWFYDNQPAPVLLSLKIFGISAKKNNENQKEYN